MNGKNKGSSFERLISKKLSTWFSKGSSDKLFWRSIGSGSFYTKYQQDVKNQEGDITAISDEGKIFIDSICIECKHYKDANLWSFFKDTNDKLKIWWTKLLGECKSQEKYPMLILRKNNSPIVFFTNEKFSKKLTMFFGDEIQSRMDVRINDEIISIYLFEDLLKLDVEIFKSMLNI